MRYHAVCDDLMVRVRKPVRNGARERADLLDRRQGFCRFHTLCSKAKESHEW